MPKSLIAHLQKTVVEGRIQHIKEEIDDPMDEIRYKLFGEGPGFTTSQGAGFAFLDNGGTLDDNIKEGNFTLEDGFVVMEKEFRPEDYLDPEEMAQFPAWWAKNSNQNQVNFGDDSDIEFSLKTFSAKIVLVGGRYIYSERANYQEVKRARREDIKD